MPDRIDRIDHSDTARATLDRDVTIDEAARAFLSSPPAFARALMAVRDVFARVLRLKRATRIDPKTPIEIGQRRGPFRVIAKTPDELVLGEDDRHLDFRVTLRTPERTLVVTTDVRYRNRLGRIYFAAIRPFHYLVVRAMTRRAARALTTRRSSSPDSSASPPRT